MTDHQRTLTHARYPQFQEDQRQFFDELVTADWAAYQDPVWDRVRRFEVEQLFQRIAPQRVLDVGCGCGYHDLLMAQYDGVTEVTGIDYSAKSIEAANQVYPHPKVTREVADVFTLPAPDRPADLVVSFQVIEHLRDAQGFMQSCARQARQGGWVAVLTPNRRRLQNRLLALCRRPLALVDPQHFREFSLEELSVLGRGAGLEYQERFGHGLDLVIPRLRWSVIPQRLSCELGYWFSMCATNLCAVFRKP